MLLMLSFGHCIVEKSNLFLVPFSVHLWKAKEM
jgi:hypothetical protein